MRIFLVFFGAAVAIALMPNRAEAITLRAVETADMVELVRLGSRPQLVCTGGKALVQDRCVCPQGTIEQFGKCVARLQPIPQKVVCPKGTKLIQGRCLPIVR